jgi:hypothetical protein
MSINLDEIKPENQSPTPAADKYAPPKIRKDMLTAIEAEISRTPLDEIAGRIARLTYGELKDLASGIAGDADKIWEWAFAKAEKRK